MYFFSFFLSFNFNVVNRPQLLKSTDKSPLRFWRIFQSYHFKEDCHNLSGDGWIWCYYMNPLIQSLWIPTGSLESLSFFHLPAFLLPTMIHQQVWGTWLWKMNNQFIGLCILATGRDGNIKMGKLVSMHRCKIGQWNEEVKADV